jgi:hypothetical protein
VGLNTNGRNACLAGGLGDVVTHIALHSGIPDAAGSLEVAGGGYARQPVTWTAAADAARDNTATLTHSMPAGSTAAFYGLWGALAAGVFYGSVPRVGVGEAASGFGTVDAAGIAGNVVQSGAHGLADATRAVLTATLAETLPAGLNATTIYHVVGATLNTFQLSLTSGGPAVDITGQGELFWQRVTPEVFAAAGTHLTSAGVLRLSSAVV